MWCCFHQVVMEFMLHGFPPSASCMSSPSLSLAVLFMFAHVLFSTIISHLGKLTLGVREKTPSLPGRWCFWLQLRFEASCDQRFNILGYDRQYNLILLGFINHYISLRLHNPSSCSRCKSANLPSKLHGGVIPTRRNIRIRSAGLQWVGRQEKNDI